MTSSDFKKTFGPYATREHGHLERLVVTAGFQCFHGNHGPYFSITYERTDGRLVGGKLVPVKNGGASFGMLSHIPSDVPELAVLKDALPFHLFEPESGPMHYLANGLYRLKQAAGEYQGTTHEPRSDEQPFEMFLRHVCWGTLPTDSPDPSEVRRLLLSVSSDARSLWLEGRLLPLRVRFLEVIDAAGLDDKLGQAERWFEEEEQARL